MVKVEALEKVVMDDKTGTVKAKSPVSVLEDEAGNSNESQVLITKEMEAEEEALSAIRIKTEQEALESAIKAAPALQSNFSKLDQLLERARAYSEFLYKQMANMNAEAEEEPQVEEKPKGRGRGKRKAPAKGRARLSKRANPPSKENAIKTEEDEDEKPEANGDKGLSEEELNMREQAKLAPLLTGGKLKGYQLEGIKWLISLWQNGINGILADQMGLGKTVQTIGFIAHLLHRGLSGPFLIVAPLSTLSNWINEIKRWIPGVPVLLYHGYKEKRANIRSKVPQNLSKDFPIFVTSFEIAMLDRSFLQHYQWKYLVVDEGHRLKNFECKLIRELKKLQVDNALLLTGTPLQNNLRELWSLLNFILPEIFSSSEEFTSWFDLQGGKDGETDQETSDKERSAQVLTMLHQILRPFLLRRLKEDVERSLPRKKEVLLYAQMTPKQRVYNEHLVQKTLEDYLHSNADMPTFSKTRLNNVLMQLRKNCNHPDLLQSQFENTLDYPPVDELVSQCGKLQLLDRLLPKLKAHGHKVLIFSQMTRLLDILEYYLQRRGHNPFRIDGSVKQEVRQEQIKDFQTDPSAFVFLLSTRAGGLGINLTAADTVIIYDSDWNPHMDMQAMDRCHRIGQTKPVHVYRLATSHSVEGKMLSTANKKVKLEHLVIEKGEFSKLEKDAHTKQKAPEIDEVISLLRPEQSDEENFVQSAEISDENIELLFDRSDLTDPTKGENLPSKLPPLGPGWKMVTYGGAQGSVLASIS